MKFWWEHHKVVIHGIHPESVRAIKTKKLHKVKEDSMQLSMLCVTQVKEDQLEETSTAVDMISLSSLSTTIAAPIEELLAEYADIF